MTGLDALGPPKGNPYSQDLTFESATNRMMPEIERRLWTRESEIAGPDSTLVDIATMGGVAPAMGKGMAESTLALVRGAHWLGDVVSFGGLGKLIPRESVPSTIYDLMPEEAGMRLASRLADYPSVATTGGEIVGSIASLLPGGGMVQKAATLPGQAIRTLGWPGRKVGEMLAKSASVQQYAKVARTLPPLLASASGFGLYNYTTADGDQTERLAAGLHGAMAGAILYGAGKVASMAERKLLDKALSPNDAEFLASFSAKVKSGKMPSLREFESASKAIGPKSVAAMIEGFGFAGLDSEFWKLALAGDPKATEIYIGSVAGALLARTGQTDAFGRYRREAPDLNNFSLRMDVMDIRRGGGRQEPQGGPQEPQPAAPAQEPLQLSEGLKGGQDAGIAVVEALSDPLFKAGWEMSEATDPGMRTIELEFPGSGTVRFTESGATYRMEIPASVYKTVRGEAVDADQVVLEGAMAEEFARDLAAVSMMRRMGGEIQFTGREAWAGGPWVGDDGRLHTVGLDGSSYSRSWPNDPGEPWRKEKSVPAGMDLPAPTQGIQRWMDLSTALRRTATPNPGLDMIETSVLTAINGNPESVSVQQLRRLLDGMSADQIAQMLNPRNVEEIGAAMASVGAGHSTAERAAQTIEAALQMQPEPAVQTEAGSEEIAALQSEYNDAKSALDAIGPEPHKPSSEKRAFGSRGIAEADPDAVARWRKETAAYNSWKRKYSRLKKAEVEASNNLFHAQRSRSGEAGFVDVGAVGEGLVAGAKGLVQAAKTVGREASRVTDYAIESQAEVVRKAMPEETISFKGRRALSDARRIRGEAAAKWRPAEAAAKKLGKGWRRETVPTESGTGEYAAWELLADRKKLPTRQEGTSGETRLPARTGDDPMVRQFVEGIQDMGTYLWETARQSGMARHGSKGIEWLPEKDKSVVQRFPGKDAPTVMGDSKLRRTWFRTLAEENPGLSASALEKAWVAQNGGKADIETVDVDSAMEHMRTVQNVPHWLTVDGKRYQMRESDPYKVVQRILDTQPRAIAAHQQFGSDWSPQERAALGEGLTPETRKLLVPGTFQTISPDAIRGDSADVGRVAALQRPGPKELVSQWSQRFFGEQGPAMDTGRKKEIQKTLEDWVETIQGGRPMRAGTWSRRLQQLAVIPKSARTVKAPVYDLTELVTQPALYVGLANAMRGYRRILSLGGPVEAIRFYERLGSITHKMGDLIWEEASGTAAKVATGLGVIGEATERFKAAVFSAVADVVLDDWAAGKASPGHADLLNEMRFSPEDAATLLVGKANDALRAQFRNEFVVLLTSRGERGEVSRMIDNPNVTAHLWFARWASGRMMASLRRLQDMKNAARDHGVASKEFVKATRRYVRQAAFWTGSGVGSLLLAYWATSLFRGEDLESGGFRPAWDRLQREFAESPVALLAEAYSRQATGGPLSQVSQLVAEPSMRNMASLTVVGDLAVNGIEALHAANRGDAAFLMDFMGKAGYVPLYADAKRLAPKLADAWRAEVANEILSKRVSAIEDGDVAWDFKRRNVDRGILGLKIQEIGQFPKTKSARFYNAMSSAVAEFYRGAAQVEGRESQAKAGFERSLQHLEKALKEDDVSPQSLAGYIRAQKHFHGWKQKDVAAFQGFLGDDRRMVRMLDHDALLDAYATAAGRMRGEPAPEWETDLEDFRKLVALGGGDVGGMVDKAIESTLSKVGSAKSEDDFQSDYLDALAPIIAGSDEAVRQAFTGKDGEALLEVKQHAMRTHYIRGLLTERAVNRYLKRQEEPR